jgi:hypothetical protein
MRQIFENNKNTLKHVDDICMKSYKLNVIPSDLKLESYCTSGGGHKAKDFDDVSQAIF